MSSGFMIDDIIKNILRSNKLECHEEEDYCFLTNIENKNNMCTGGQFKEFTGRNSQMSV